MNGPRFDDLLASVPDAVIVVDEDTTLLYANLAAERLFGWRAEERLGLESLSLIHPEDQEFALLSAQSVMEKEIGSPIELRVMSASGWRLVEMIGTRCLDDRVRGIVLSLRDLTERRKWEVAGDDLALFRTIMQNSATLTLLVDESGLVLATSAAMTRLLGHDPGEVKGTQLADLVVAVDRSRFADAWSDAIDCNSSPGERRVNIDVGMRTRDGDPAPFQLTIVNLVDDPTAPGLVVSGQDISELHAVRRQLAHAAEHDELTGLPNRALLSKVLAHRLSDDGPRSTAVAFIDVDRFKVLNDLFGHEVGDEVLVTLARRLRNAVRETDVVARLGGDEFVVVTSAKSDSEARDLVGRLDAAVSETMQLRTGPIQVFASIGLVMAHPGDEMNVVLAEADAAMYEEKSRGLSAAGGRTRPLAERRSLAEDLNGAFRHGQFEVHYQPVVALADVRTVGLEALVRWNHPRRGLLLPSDFVDVVEDARRDAELADFVFSTALSDLGDFGGVTDELSISVNLAASQLAENGFPERIANLVTSAGFRPGDVIVELSERSLLDNSHAPDSNLMRTSLQAISDCGFRIAVDDFGTGYASLTHLVSFPIDILKIDRSFVSGVGHDKSREAIVSAVVALAERAGMTVIAEGVEQESQLAAVRRLGCTHGQGFYFSRPMPTKEVVAELRARAILGEASVIAS